ncbi:hypothetical protein H8E88_04010 [candidate division KSB1 bacterium]|nr:hypothetical protein [candidate division KSB1 bacterium]
MNVQIKKREVYTIINELANKLNISENEIVQKAIYEYAKKEKKSRLMSFAGILDENDADELINMIQKSRTDKHLELGLSKQ